MKLNLAKMKLKKTLLFLALAIAILSACEAKKSNETVSIGPDTLSYATAKKYVKNYEKHAGFVDSIFKENDSLTNGIKKLPDTRAIWFGIDRLEAMVKKIKEEGGDGVRFYLATYDDKYPKDLKNGYKPDIKYWGYNTLIMVSTKDSINKYHRDYYSNKTGSKGFILGVTTDPENRGEMCPPPANCTEIGATLIEE